MFHDFFKNYFAARISQSTQNASRLERRFATGFGQDNTESRVFWMGTADRLHPLELMGDLPYESESDS